MSGSYVARVINVTIHLGEGTFGQSGFNTVKLTGLRVSATIQKGGFPSMDRAEIRVYGVPPTVMNAVSTLGIPIPMVRHNNSVLIEAGDAVNGMAVVFSGYLAQAWQDFEEAPDTALVIVSWGGKDQATFPAKPISYPGYTDVATIMSGLALTMNYNFENNGVTAQLPPCYFAGTALEQAHAVARAANIEMYIDTGTASPTLAIWPKNATRNGVIPLINAASGLVGYPTFRDQGMKFRCLFNQNIRLAGQIQMQSIVGQPATPSSATGAPSGAGPQSGGPNGRWCVITPLTHSLSSQLPGGPWFTDVSCARVLVPGATP